MPAPSAAAENVGNASDTFSSSPWPRIARFGLAARTQTVAPPPPARQRPPRSIGRTERSAERSARTSSARWASRRDRRRRGGAIDAREVRRRSRAVPAAAGPPARARRAGAAQLGARSPCPGSGAAGTARAHEDVDREHAAEQRGPRQPSRRPRARVRSQLVTGWAVATLLPLRWALGGSRGRSRALALFQDCDAYQCAQSRFRRCFRGFTRTQFSESPSGGARPSQG